MTSRSDSPWPAGLILSCLAVLWPTSPASAQISAETSAADFVRRVDATNDWRAWFQLGLDLADKPAEEGYATLQAAWPRLAKPACRQQILKAWHFSTPMPLRMRMHPHILDVLALGLADGDETTRDWARNFLESYAWEPLATPETAAEWLKNHKGAEPAQAWKSAVAAWVKKVNELNQADGLHMVEMLPRWGYPLRRNPELQDMARSIGLDRVLETWLAKEELSGKAALQIYAHLMDLNPSKYTQEKYKAFSDQMIKRDEARAAANEKKLRDDARRVGDDPRKSWILHAPAESVRPPSTGFGLLVVLPGGDGSASFAPFVGDTIHAAAGKDRYFVAQVIAPPIPEGDQDAVVWPTARLHDSRIEFSMEPVILEIVKTVRSDHPIDDSRVFIMGWSSSGTTCYAMTMEAQSPFRGAFVAMSVFKPDLLPPAAGAKGRRFYLLHSPQDFIPMSFPENAKKTLSEAGAEVQLVTYEGGHGWHGDVLDNITKAIRWLESGGG